MVVATILAFSFPAFSYAATYMYVNQSGQVNTVVADSPSMAMTTAPGIAMHSGVALLSNTGVVLGTNTSTPTTYNTMTYAYVNQAGTVMTISANSPAAAFANAPGIDASSGVMLLSNTSGNNGIVGNYVSGI